MTRTGLAFVLGVLAVASSGWAQPVPGKPGLRERAAKGDADAQFTLGKNYEAGRGGLQRDFAEAGRWYRMAAEQGDVFAQASLGILYRFGKGVPQDYVQAYQWFYLAAAHSSGGEQESIAEMRDSLAAHMTPEQKAEALRLAQSWKPKATAAVER